MVGWSEEGAHGTILPTIIMSFSKHLGLNLIVWNGKKAYEKYSDPESRSFGYSNPLGIVSPNLIDPSLISSLVDETKRDDSILSQMLKKSNVRVDGSTYDFGFKNIPQSSSPQTSSPQTNVNVANKSWFKNKKREAT